MNDHLEAHAASSFENLCVARINGARARMDQVPPWVLSGSAMRTTTSAIQMITSVDTRWNENIHLTIGTFQEHKRGTKQLSARFIR